MINRFKSILVVLFIFCLTFALSANQNEKPKNFNFYSKLKVKHSQKKNEKINKCCFSKTKNFSSVKNRGEVKIFTNEILDEKFVDNLDYDVNVAEDEIISKIIFSKFGEDLSQLSSDIFVKFKELYDLLELELNLLGIDKNDLLELFDLTQDDLCDLNIDDFIDDINNFKSFISYFRAGDFDNAEITIKNIDNFLVKDIGLSYVFGQYIYNKEPQMAEKILSFIFLEDLDDDDEDSFFEHYDYLEALVISYLQNKDFKNAERVANLAENDTLERDSALVYVVKYYLKINDISNAKRIIDNISDSICIENSLIYLLDYYARNKNMVDFQKIVFENTNIPSIKKVAQFILAIYQNDFEKAIRIQLPERNFKVIIDNFIEMLASANRVDEAENFINIFLDEDEKNDYLLFFINAYLKNNKIEEAKRLSNEIQSGQDFEGKFSRWMVSKLISIYETK